MKVKFKIVFLLAIIGLIIIEGCQNRKAKEDLFWKWFIDHQNDYYIDSSNTKLFNNLTHELNKVDKNLTFEFSPIDDNGIKELTISAAGLRESFSSVINLTNKAPKLKRWKFNAFRQRKPENYESITYGNLELTYDDVYFKYTKESDKLGIELYVRNYKDTIDFNQATFLLLDGLLGEYDVETLIGTIEIRKLDESEKESLFKFKELQGIVDKYKKN